MIKHLFISASFMSCSTAQQEKATSFIDIIYVHRTVPTDTLILYNIKGISTQGAESRVNYKNGKILRSETIIYGEAGQATINYEFENKKIKVVEILFTYNKNLENIK